MNDRHTAVGTLRANVWGRMKNSLSSVRGGVVLTGLLYLAACSSDPLAPKPNPGVQAHWGNGNDRDNNGWHNDGRGHGRWRFNTDKYKDNGSRPATGSAGVASVQAEALIGDKGITQLEVYSFRSTNLDQPDGDIDRMTIKAFSPQGRLILTRTYRDGRVRSAFVDVFGGLVPGAYFQIEAAVSGLDRRRVDVVTVAPVTVRRRPDLAVTNVAAPSVLVAGAPAVITASVAELHGERGARTDCVLYVGNRPVDRSRGIWVDAGDVVSCAFTTSFREAGRYALRVAVEHTTPRDQDGDNNSRTIAVTAIAPSPAPAPGAPAPVTADFNAFVRSGSFTTVDSGAARWTLLNSGFLLFDTRYQYTTLGVEQTAIMSGVLSTAVPFPVSRIELKQTTGGLLVHSATFDNADADFAGSSCLSRGAGSGVSFYLCADPMGFTTWSYVRSAGSVTYQSTNYENVWNGATYDVNTYVDNSSTDSGAPIPLGATFGFDVRLTSGANYYVTAVTVPLGPSNVSDVTPWQCQNGSTTSASGELIATSGCFASSYLFTGVAGAVQGSGVIAQPGASSVP